MAASVPIYFVVRLGHANLGSAKMRGGDLARIVGPHLGDRLTAKVITMPGRKVPALQRLWARTRARGGIYFLTKSCFPMDPEAAALLRARALGVCLDYVDHNLEKIASEQADVHVCASYAQADLIRAMQAEGRFAAGPVQVVLHNADGALYGLQVPERTSFSTVYCGNAINTRIPEALAGEVAFLDGSKPHRMQRGLARLPEFALHYCLRDQGGERATVVKPFTKGATAAVCGANVLTSRDVPDAVRLLGGDYPFFTDGTGDAAIIAGFERAREAFGGAEWRRGLEAMAGLREAVSGPALAAQVRQMAALLGVE